MKRRIVFLVLIVLFIGSLVFLAGTRTGLQFVLDRLPLPLEAELQEGTLSRGFVLNNVQLEISGNRITAERLQLDWLLGSILLNHLDILSLTVQGLKVTLSGSNNGRTRTEFTVPELPIDISLRELKISGIEVTGNRIPEPVTLDRLQLSARTEGQRLHIDAMEVVQGENQLLLDGQVRLGRELSHTLASRWRYQTAADQRRFAGTATIQGNLQRTEVRIPITEPLQAEITIGLNEPVNNLAWTVDASIPAIDPSLYVTQLPPQSFSVFMNGSGTRENAKVNGTVRMVDSGAPGGEFEFNNLELLLTSELDNLTSNDRAARGTLSWPRIALITSGHSLQIENGQLAFEYADNQLQLDSQSGFNVDDRAVGDWDIQGTATADNVHLETLSVNLAQGALTGNLSINDFRNRPDVDARLRWDRFTLAATSDMPGAVTSGTLELSGRQEDYQATLTGDVIVDEVPPISISLSASGNQTATRIQTLTLNTLEGTVTGLGEVFWTDGPRAELTLTGQDINPAAYWSEWPGRIALDTALSLQMRDQQPELELTRLSVTGDLREHLFRLELPASYSNRTLEIRNGTLSSGASSVRVDGMLSREQNDLHWVLDSPDLAELFPRLQGRVQASGRLSGSVRQPALVASMEADRLDSPWGRLEALKGNIHFNETIDAQLQMQKLFTDKAGFDTLRLDVKGTPAAHSWQLTISQQAYQLNAQGQATYLDHTWSTRLNPLEVTTKEPDSGWPPGGLVADQAYLNLHHLDLVQSDYKQIGIEAGLEWQLEDLSFLDGLGLQIADIHGALNTDITVNGTLGDPRVNGLVQLADSEFIVPVLGIRVDQINARANTLQNGNYALTGQSRSGNGQLRLQAEMQPPGQLPLSASGTIRGDNIEIINVPEIRALASPDIRLSLRGNRPRIGGTITIPEAQINLDEFRDTIVLSEDVVLSDKAEPAPRRATVDADIELQFGDRINLEGQGLRGRVTGNLNVYSNERGELLGNGEVAIVDGKFSAYGQSLVIEQGRLIFARSRLDNPELRITAVRRIDETLSAGLRISGYASNPVITLFSTPAMSDDEVLAYIVFGRPLQSLTSGEGTDLIGAATALGLRNTDFLTRRLSSTFGLDRLQITSDSDGGDAAVEIGKYITPKLYISYAMSVFERVVTGNIRYDLNSNWSLEVKSSTDVGVDLFYKIQK